MPKYLPLELGLSSLLGLLERTHFDGRVLCVLDQFPSKVTRFQMQPRVKAVDYPHLVPGSACGYVVALFESVVLAEWKRPIVWHVHQRQEHHVSLISLEVRRIAAYDVPLLKLGHGQPLAQQLFDLQSLRFTDQRNDTEALPFVFGLLDRSGH
jgi:hypothetical protein